MRTLAKQVTSALFIFVLLAAALGQQNSAQRADTPEHILDAKFRLATTTEDILLNIKQAFCQLSRQSSFAIANPGRKYQVGDVVLDRTLPRRRLVFAGINEDKWLIHYERGGRGRGYDVVMFKVGQN